jgi:hypothetical protein
MGCESGGGVSCFGNGKNGPKQSFLGFIYIKLVDSHGGSRRFESCCAHIKSITYRNRLDKFGSKCCELSMPRFCARVALVRLSTWNVNFGSADHASMDADFSKSPGTFGWIGSASVV